MPGLGPEPFLNGLLPCQDLVLNLRHDVGLALPRDCVSVTVAQGAISVIVPGLRSGMLPDLRAGGRRARAPIGRLDLLHQSSISSLESNVTVLQLKFEVPTACPEAGGPLAGCSVRLPVITR